MKECIGVSVIALWGGSFSAPSGRISLIRELKMCEGYKPDEEDRVNAVLDILKGVTTAEEIRKKFNIVTINSVYTWIGKYVTQEKALSLEEQSDEDMAKKSKDDQIRDLQAQLSQARKEAELEKLRAKAYDTMINVAEETFNIPIRKKSGTKR